jgi:DNA polymerase-1
MQQHVYAPADDYPIALLVKESAFSPVEIDRACMFPLENRGVARDSVIVVALPYKDNGKAPGGFIRDQLNLLLPDLLAHGVKHLYCADAGYFKILTKSSKAEPHLGYVLKCALKGYEHLDVTLGVNHRSLAYNPVNESKLDLSLNTLADLVTGNYSGIGTDIVQNALYPQSLTGIKAALDMLLLHPHLTCDAETFGLSHDKAGLGTISFAWNQHEGIAFPCDYRPILGSLGPVYGENVPNPEVRALVKDFLTSYRGSLTFHRATFDIKILIAVLWMEHLADTEGLLKGLEILTRRFGDTKVIAYLATNTTAGNETGLKALAHPFAGNWGMGDDIKDITRIPLKQLLQYNLVDCLSTHWVFNKYYPKMVADYQEELYHKVMLPSAKTIIQVELTGMPLCKQSVLEAQRELKRIIYKQDKILASAKIITALEDALTRKDWQKDFEARRDKAKNPHKIVPKDWATYPRWKFNPASGDQLRVLLFDTMGLPILSRTATGLGATGGDDLEKLTNHTTNPDYLAILDALRLRAEADKILNTFIKAFLLAIRHGEEGNIVWLHGSFNLGGTLSGRLSSSDPNLQNLPSGSTYGKLIKKCFQAPAGWIFCGADFNALEDRINALITKDPNKLKVFTDGYDSHSLRTYYYWPHLFPEVNPNDPVSVNALKDHPLRGKSKGPSFALQYMGTWKTLVNNAGFTPQEAKAIEANFLSMYGVSMQWVRDRIDQAAKDGYATAAFGLRIRTPLLSQTIRGHSTTPYEAEAEGRSVGNAISGQSYGLLNNRALNEFMDKVWASPYRHDILPCALIHDALYFVVKDDVDVVEWVNRELIKAMGWQELPEIQHEIVKLEAELDLYWPSWADALTLPNEANEEQIRALVAKHRQSLHKDAA